MVNACNGSFIVIFSAQILLLCFLFGVGVSADSLNTSPPVTNSTCSITGNLTLTFSASCNSSGNTSATRNGFNWTKSLFLREVFLSNSSGSFHLNSSELPSNISGHTPKLTNATFIHANSSCDKSFNQPAEVRRQPIINNVGGWYVSCTLSPGANVSADQGGKCGSEKNVSTVMNVTFVCYVNQMDSSTGKSVSTTSRSTDVGSTSQRNGGNSSPTDSSVTPGSPKTGTNTSSAPEGALAPAESGNSSNTVSNSTTPSSADSQGTSQNTSGETDPTPKPNDGSSPTTNVTVSPKSNGLVIWIVLLTVVVFIITLGLWVSDTFRRTVYRPLSCRRRNSEDVPFMSMNSFNSSSPSVDMTFE